MEKREIPVVLVILVVPFIPVNYTLSILTIAINESRISSILLTMTSLKSQAIQTALTGDWDHAIVLNLQLLKETPDDIETLNRLAFAYAIVGNTDKAKQTYQKVLILDIQNPIALRGLKRLNSPKTDHVKDLTSCASQKFTNMFLEESGKTKIISLANVAETKIISGLRTGEQLILCIKRSKVFVLDWQKQYIGVVPDNIGNRLIKFLNGGNCYEAYIKSIEDNKVSVFVKETKRASKFKNQASFLSTSGAFMTVEATGNKDYSRLKLSTLSPSEDGG